MPALKCLRLYAPLLRLPSFPPTGVLLNPGQHLVTLSPFRIALLRKVDPRLKKAPEAGQPKAEIDESFEHSPETPGKEASLRAIFDRQQCQDKKGTQTYQSAQYSYVASDVLQQHVSAILS